MLNRRMPGRLMLITDLKLFADEKTFLQAAEKALRGGVDAIQLREKTLNARQVLGLAHELKKLTDKFNAALIINERVDIAKLASAHGVHLPETAFSPRDARALLGDKAIIGVSTHDPAHAVKAEAEGADYVTLSPIYHTPSKAPYGEPIGIKPLASAVKKLKIPVYALGGIKYKNIAEVMEAGAAGIALISAILASHEIEKSARELRDELIYYDNNKSRKAL